MAGDKGYWCRIVGVAVMSYHIWQQKYASDPSVVGAAY